MRGPHGKYFRMVETPLKSDLFQGNSGHSAKLVKDSLSYLGPVDLMQYFVKSYSAVDRGDHLRLHAHGNEGLKVDFVFSRRLLNQLLTVFMPTCAICLISFTTSFFKVG